jgi:hypothetical protein
VGVLGLKFHTFDRPEIAALLQQLVFSERLTCLTPNCARLGNDLSFESELLMLLHLRSTTLALQSMTKAEHGKSSWGDLRS